MDEAEFSMIYGNRIFGIKIPMYDFELFREFLKFSKTHEMTYLKTIKADGNIYLAT